MSDLQEALRLALTWLDPDNTPDHVIMTIESAIDESVRTKDLTDDEIMKINVDTASIVPTCDRQFHFARAVIAADREKNK